MWYRFRHINTNSYTKYHFIVEVKGGDSIVTKVSVTACGRELNQIYRVEPGVKNPKFSSMCGNCRIKVGKNESIKSVQA